MGRAAYDEKTYLDSNGRKYFYRFWKAKRTRAALVIFHALGLHSGRYAWLCEELASRGVSCFAPDLYGHGLSEGVRGGGSLGKLLASARTFVQLVRSKCDSCDLYLAGHGAGALVALAVSTPPLRRVFALSPVAEVAHYWRFLPRLKLLAALRVRVNLDPHPLYDIKHRDALLEAEEDNLVVRKIPAKLIAETLHTLRSNQRFDANLVILAENKSRNSECYSAFKRSSGIVEAEMFYDPDLQDFPIENLVEKLIERSRGASEP